MTVPGRGGGRSSTGYWNSFCSEGVTGSPGRRSKIALASSGMSGSPVTCGTGSEVTGRDSPSLNCTCNCLLPKFCPPPTRMDSAALIGLARGSGTDVCSDELAQPVKRKKVNKPISPRSRIDLTFKQHNLRSEPFSMARPSPYKTLADSFQFRRESKPKI